MKSYTLAQNGQIQRGVESVMILEDGRPAPGKINIVGAIQSVSSGGTVGTIVYRDTLGHNYAASYDLPSGGIKSRIRLN